MTDRDGPLPPLLLGLTVVTGLVDAVSYLALGHVFVANMTGNVIFLGLAAVGVPGVSALTSLTSITAFLAAGVAGGRMVRAQKHRGKLVAQCASAELLLVAACALVAAWSGGEVARLALIVLLALAMGLQNTVARALAVPDMLTTVLTMTLTGLAAEIAAGRRHRREHLATHRCGRRDARRRADRGNPYPALLHRRGIDRRNAAARGNVGGRTTPLGDRSRRLMGGSSQRASLVRRRLLVAQCSPEPNAASTSTTSSRNT
jgi:uncharacterized membrane protein YoaK (UPF0700 family)